MTFGMGGIELDPTGLYHTAARTYHPTLQRFLSEDPSGYGGGDINLFAYAGTDPVGTSDPSGLDACPGGDCGGGGPNPPGGVPNIFYLYFFNGSSSSGPAVWDSFTHFWEKAQLAGSLRSAGVSDGQVLLAQEDGEGEGPEGLEGAEEQQIEENIEKVEILDRLGRPRWAHTPGGFVGWLETIENPKGSPLTAEQADAIVKEARQLGLNVRLDPAHEGRNEWTSPHLNVWRGGANSSAHVLVPDSYKLP
jgi:RHS repeat-associated protein